MVWHILAWQWLANAAVGGLIVLALGGLAVRLCRQPARRSRLVVLAILGALIVPWIGMMQVPLPFRLAIAPGWLAGLLRPVEKVAARGPATTSIAVFPGAIPLDTGELGSPSDANPPPVIADAARSDSGVGRWPSMALATLVALPWQRLVLVAFAPASVGLLTWWVLGQVVLWRVTRGARPVTRAVQDQFLAISGPAGSRVRLLESDRIALPFTFTWTRPVILMPSALCARGDEEALNYALAHEWAHIENRDAWAWNLTAVAGVVLFYQPLFWWLRRQLRLCQDYLADDRAAAVGSPEDYAACLVRLARESGCGRRRAFGSVLPALGICDHPSNLSRRVTMLINDRGPIEHRCPRSWSLGAAGATVLAILIVAGFGADATPATDSPNRQAPKAEPKGDALHYSGKVKDKETGKPIPGATVTVRRTRDDANEGHRIIEETRHTTNAEGIYSFTIPPEQVAEKSLYLEFDIEHPDYATRAGEGYGLTAIRRDETKGHRPFFENITLRPARPVLGRIETPEGKPAEGVEIVAYSLTHKVQSGPREQGSFTRVKTDQDGRFRAPITTPGVGVFWIVPGEYAPELHAIPEGRRGEIGTFRLKKGITVRGRAIDAQGKPLTGMFVNIKRDIDSSPDREILAQLAASDLVERSAETNVEGRFTFDPLPPGVYVVEPGILQNVPGQGWIRRPLPGVFAPQKVTIKAGETPNPIEIRTASFVVIEGGWIDSKSRPRTGRDLIISGHIEGQTWLTIVKPSADGKFSVQVPRGMDNAQITLSLGSFASTRYRVGKDGKLEAGQYIMFGKHGLDHDVKDIQIVRYDPTGMIVKAITKDGRAIKDIILAGEYTGEIASARGMVGLPNGASTEIVFERQADGRFRADDLTPDREVKITAYADGFQPASRKFRVAEGKTEAVSFVMEPK